ncbi:Serine phosphatase RsbU regulator of sigma subunit [Geitlerinema sp. FC II]|nr:PP2C family protein-serine/threonine phosphatase [Geitlerinema sp. CS-897]PPT08089.1 Serine phosphatase RsbU regulator of sigma subunit [Geitlerinema sp. FC II]
MSPERTDLNPLPAVSVSLQPATPNEPTPPSEPTPVFALKALVARLHREQNKTQDLLSSLGFALRSFNNLNQFLELIPLVASRVTDAEGGALILFKPDGQIRLQRLHCQEGQSCTDMRRAIETVTRQLEPEGATPGELDERVAQYLGEELRLFGTPISIQDKERGRLYVFSCDPNYRWTETRRKLVQLVADQTAVAIVNDELAAELRQKQRLDRELEIGAEIQLRLLPSQCPEIQGIRLAARCQTANRVGGDYYDFIPTSHDLVRSRRSEASGRGRWGIAIGDVMGKGVPAGLIMTLTRGMLRSEALNQHSPARILQHLNRAMYADLENSHRFVTLFYSEYDPKTETLSYSNAAHNPPLLWTSKTDEMSRLDTWGMLVGLDAETEYEEDSVVLEDGDTILFYTDGFTEASNQHGDRFDEENLVEAFHTICQRRQTPEEILNYMFDRVHEFIGPHKSNDDDMTLVVLQKNEPS